MKVNRIKGKIRTGHLFIYFLNKTCFFIIHVELIKQLIP